MDIHGAGRLQSMDGSAGTGYDVGQVGAVGAVASGTDGFNGTVGGTSNPSTSAGHPCSRSHGNTVPSVPSLAASSRSPPLVVPTRADLETVKRMMKGDTYIGRGCRQRGLTRSVFGNPYKVCDYGRSQAVAKYRQLLDDSTELSSQLINLSGRRLLCHCKRFQQCHADAIIAKCAELCPGAHDRDRTAERVPTSEELNLMAILREEPSSDEGSTADEGVPDKGSGWVGSGPPMRVGVGYRP